MPKLANFAVSKDTLLKVGIAVAVALILYLVLRSATCSKREAYAMFAAPRRPARDDEYAENMYEASGRGAPVDDYAEEEYYPEADAATADPSDAATLAAQPDYYVMQSTLDDDEANAQFSPDA